MTTRGAVLQWMAAIGVAVSLAWGGGHAWAQDDPEDPIAQARELFAEAEEAYGAHRYATAAELFRRVHELMEGHPRQYLVLFNLGQCLADAGEYEAGIETLERYLVAGGDRVENRGEVEQRIRALRETELAPATDGDGLPPARSTHASFGQRRSGAGSYRRRIFIYGGTGGPLAFSTNDDVFADMWELRVYE